MKSVIVAFLVLMVTVSVSASSSDEDRDAWDVALDNLFEDSITRNAAADMSMHDVLRLALTAPPRNPALVPDALTVLTIMPEKTADEGVVVDRAALDKLRAWRSYGSFCTVSSHVLRMANEADPTPDLHGAIDLFLDLVQRQCREAQALMLRIAAPGAIGITARHLMSEPVWGSGEHTYWLVVEGLDDAQLFIAAVLPVADTDRFDALRRVFSNRLDWAALEADNVLFRLEAQRLLDTDAQAFTYNELCLALSKAEPFATIHERMLDLLLAANADVDAAMAEMAERHPALAGLKTASSNAQDRISSE